MCIRFAKVFPESYVLFYIGNIILLYHVDRRPAIALAAFGRLGDNNRGISTRIKTYFHFTYGKLNA